MREAEEEREKKGGKGENVESNVGGSDADGY